MMIDVDTALLARLRELLSEPLSQLDLAQLGKHNVAYSRHYAGQRFERFVKDEWPYYRHVLRWYRANVPKGSSVLEIGMFIPVIPIALSLEGYRVTTIEKLSLYGDALAPMVRLVEAHGVSFQNADVVNDALSLPTFDCVNLLAVVEHLLGSPKKLLGKIHSFLNAQGKFIFVVPNQARLARRLALFLRGESVQPRFEDYFDSEYPFEGHHREYTQSEVRHALNATGYRIEILEGIRYPGKTGVASLLAASACRLLPSSFQQVHFAVARLGRF